MQDAAICIFAWDFADEGVDRVLDFVAASGLTSLYMASVYHAGWLVLPHNPRRTCYWVEDGVAYFHPQQSYFESTCLKPQVARMAESTDWFEVVGERLPQFGLKLTAWTVCYHNTRLGLTHPNQAVCNALGDVYPHALTPASAEVRSYVVGLARSLCERYPLQSIFLEAPNYGGRCHDHHHARSFTPLGPLENDLLDISFSKHDLAWAAERGVDGNFVQDAVAQHLKAYLKSVPDRPRGMPETIEQFVEKCPSLPAYRNALDNAVSSLVSLVHDAVAAHNVALEGVESLSTYDWQVVGAYGKRPSTVAQLAKTAQARIAPHQRVRVGLRLGFDSRDEDGAIRSEATCRQCVAAASEGGADGIFFYNYSEAPGACLSWIKPAVAGLVREIPARTVSAPSEDKS